MNRRILTLLAVPAALSFPATTHAAGPWTVANPQGITWTAPTNCTLTLDLTTSDAYPTRGNVTQRHELVVVYRNFVEIGRTDDLADRVAQASAFKRITTEVAIGDLVTVVHSSWAGLSDGTANSVTVDATFTCLPTPTTTTTVPVTTPTTMPPTTTSTIPLPSPSTTTTTVAVGEPPVATTTPATVPPTVVTTPRPPTSTTTVPPFVLPETGTGDFLAALALIAATFCALGAVTIWLNGGQR